MIFNRVRRLICKSFQAISLIWLCSMIAGCQTTIEANIRPDYTFENKKDTGLIIGTVSHRKDVGKDASSIFFINYRSKNPLVILNSGASQFFLRKNELEGTGFYGKLFVIEVPAGRHVVDHWQIFSMHSLGTVLTPKSEPPPMNFEITAGEILYLGNFHVAINTHENILGEPIPDGGIPIIKDESKRDLRMLRERYPQFNERNVKVNVIHSGPWINELIKSQELTVPKSGEKQN